MARTALTLQQALPGAATTQTAPQAIDQVNGMNLAILASGAGGYGTFPRPAAGQRWLLIVTNSVASIKTIIFRAGSNPPSFRGPLGDITLNLPASSTVYVPLPDPSRITQADGSFNIDFGAATAGTISAVGMPAAF